MTPPSLLKLCFVAGFLATASHAPAQDWARSKLENSPRHLEWVTVKHGDREVGCYTGYPEVKEKVPAVVVIHEIFGLTDWARSVVDEFADAGYIAIAPDFLWGAGPKGGGTSELTSDQIGLKIRALPEDQITADLKAAKDYVGKLPSCNGKVVVVGFCWGGGQSFRFATNDTDIKAALVFYGSAPKTEELVRIKAPVYGFYGGNDARITTTVEPTTEAMRKAERIFDPMIYEGAGHGFMRAGEDPKNANPANKAARNAAWIRLKEILAKL